LGLNDYLPWKPAKICFQNQYDFNYLEARHLWEDAVIDSEGIHIADMHYKTLIVEFDTPTDAENAIQKLEKAGRIIKLSINNNYDGLLLNRLERIVKKDLTVFPANKDIRIRHVVKNDFHFYMIFNEGADHITAKVNFNTKGKLVIFDGSSFDNEFNDGTELHLSPHQYLTVLVKK